MGDLDRAVQLNPINAKYISYRGYVLTRFDQYDEAIEDYKRAVELNETDHNSWMQIGWYSAFKLNDYQTGKKAFAKAVELAPNNVSYLYNYALVLNNLHDCKMRPVIKQYLQLCKTTGSNQCSDNNINWAKGMDRFLKSSHTCPN